MATLKPTQLGTMSPGVNNRLPSTQLGFTLANHARATYLLAGENIDIVGGGNIKRRQGFTSAIAGSACHSLWGDGADGYCAIGNDLVHLAPAGDALVATSARDGLPEMLTLSYARLPGGEVAWSNGQEIGRLTGAVASPLATPLQPVAPSITAIAGALPSGRYQVAFTNFGPAGESRATVPLALNLPEGSGIRIAGLTSSSRVYMTGPDGSAFNEILTDGDIVSLANTGAPCRSLLLADLPPGTTVRYYNGSVLVARGNLLCWSEPYYPGIFNPSRNYIPFSKPITVVQPCENGVFVCTDKTYWLPGALNDTRPAVVLPYGGLQGSGGTVDTVDSTTGTTQAFWLSTRGLVIGSPDGTVANVQEKALKFGRARSGATLFREQDGSIHILTSRQEAARPVTAADAFYPAEDTRKAIVQ